jgi:hypothetical protein
MDAPEQILEAPVPPGWDGENGLPTTVTMFILFCEHVSLGEFERGPVQLVVESHEKFNAPDNCRQGDYSFLNILTRIVWSDAEVAAAMEHELGIPTSVGTIERSVTGSEAASMTTFAWTIDGQESSIQSGRVSNEIQEYDNSYRYVWADEGRLGLIDFSWDVLQTWLEPVAVYGSFAPPMILASTGMPVVGGIGVVNEEMFPGGEFKFFEGYECATQVWP